VVAVEFASFVIRLIDSALTEYPILIEGVVEYEPVNTLVGCCWQASDGMSYHSVILVTCCWCQYFTGTEEASGV